VTFVLTRNFVRRYAATRAVVFSTVATLFPFFDIPVFWPILLVYFIILFVITMRRQIAHMRKYKYVTPPRPAQPAPNRTGCARHRRTAPGATRGLAADCLPTSVLGTCRSTSERRRITRCGRRGGHSRLRG